MKPIAGLKRMSVTTQTTQTPVKLIRNIQDTNYKFWSETSNISIGASNIKKYPISWIVKMDQLLKTYKLLSLNLR